jgi:hypothetical protein
MMTKRFMAMVAGALCLTSACDTQEFLDVNTNPNAPQTVAANLYLAPMIHWMVTGQQVDGRFVGQYSQEWVATNSTCWLGWARMGHDAGTLATGCGGGADNGGQQWRDVYWSMGQNLVDMMQMAEAEQRWDLLGVGYVLKAWGWQALTDLHGEIIVKEAVNQGATFTFNYDTQEFAYEEVQRLLGEAIKNLQRTDGAVDPAYLGRTDKLFNGDRIKWLRLAQGMLAINKNHFTNKATYKPADVIAAVDASFGSNEDALFTYSNASTDNADRNYYAPVRNNLTVYRQTQFMLGLMDGSQLGAPDPRLSRMLAPAPDGVFRGLNININGFGTLTAAQQPMNFFGLVGTPTAGAGGRYIFSEKVKFPLMTYAQLQFVKAEAAYRSGDRATALTAYRNGITSHFAFVNARNAEDGFLTTQITTAERDAYLNNPVIVPTAANLTLTHIMSQKYIAQWGWAHNETWLDLRRYHYTDIDPASGRQVFPGFTPPTVLFVDNANKVVQRMRPRFNSEYVWNKPGLDAIGGLATDYQTKPLWITQP